MHEIDEYYGDETPPAHTWLERQYDRFRRKNICPRDELIEQFRGENPDYVDWDWIDEIQDAKKYRDRVREVAKQTEEVERVRVATLDPEFYETSGDTVINIGFDTSKPYNAPDDLVDGLIGRVCRNGIVGPSGAGKSFFGLELNVCVAASVIDPTIKFMGREILRPGGAGMFSFESSGTMEPRWRGLMSKYGDVMNDRHGNVRIPFFSVLKPKSLATEEGWQSLEDDVIRMQRLCRERFDCDLATITVDTVHASQMVAKENDSDAWKMPLAHMLRISEAYQIAFNIMHHSGKPSDGGEKQSSEGNIWRGSNSAPAAMDNIISMRTEKKEGEVKRRWLYLDKSKDGETGYLCDMQHQIHKVGEKRNGKPVTTLTFDFKSVSEKERRELRATNAVKEWKPTAPGGKIMKCIAQVSNEIKQTKQLSDGRFNYVAPIYEVEKRAKALFQNKARDWEKGLANLMSHKGFEDDRSAMSLSITQTEEIVIHAFDGLKPSRSKSG